MIAAEGVPAPLAGWESFYVIVGTSAAALTGLQFVVVALVADIETTASERTISAFATPTIVHFCATLLISAVLSAPWPTLAGADLAIGAIGGTGLAYTAVVAARARRQTGYQPVLEDWLWHAILPFAAYVALAAAAVAMWRGTDATWPLFAAGGAAVLLVFIGIHNAWDTVTYLALRHVERRAAGEAPGGGAGAVPNEAADGGRGAQGGAHRGGGRRGRRRRR